MDFTSQMEVSRIHSILLLIFIGLSTVSHSQNNHLFERRHALYISAGYLKGKRIVSGIQVQAKDSTNREIHVKMDLLKDWITVDSAEFDLFLDTAKHAFIYVNDRKYEAIHYESKDSKVQINFEKPIGHEMKTSNGMEWIYWVSAHATVNYSNRFKKYNRVLKIYYEK